MEGILEKWYWHVLYYNTWIDAHNAQQSIIREYDQYGLVRQREQGYMVLFSTNYPFDNNCRVELYATLLNVIPNDVPASAYFNTYSSDRISVISGLVNISHVLIAIVLPILLLPFIFDLCCYFIPISIMQWLVDLRIKQIDRELADLDELEGELAQQLGHQRGKC